MKIPETFKMGGHTIKVVNDDLLVARRRLGECYRDSLRIHLDKTLPESQQLETFVHEVVELASSMFDLNLQHQTVQTLGVALHQAFTSLDSDIAF